MNKNLENNKSTSAYKKIKIQFLILIALFIIAEIILRCFGMKAGTLIDDFKVEENPIYQPRFESDEVGINHILPIKEMLILGSVINEQGFRGYMNYTAQTIDSVKKSTHQQVVMIIGDSFVEGCCPDSAANSFPDIINEDPSYEVLNFGVAGTDPLQYKLVAQKYIPQLKPDKVVVVFYFGNDIINFERTPSPGTPLTYPFKNNKWLFSIAPNHLTKRVNYNFINAEEAYQFYIDSYTLKGKNRNYFEKTISYSVIFSKIYLFLEHKLAERAWYKKNLASNYDGISIAHTNLKRINVICDSLQIPCLFVGIPAPDEAEEGEKLKAKYAAIFNDLNWDVPSNLKTKDYDGLNKANHFNNIGHSKYAQFLKNKSIKPPTIK